MKGTHRTAGIGALLGAVAGVVVPGAAGATVGGSTSTTTPASTSTPPATPSTTTTTLTPTAPVTAAPPASQSVAVPASASCSNQNPGDGVTKSTGTITGGENGSYGTVTLKYSPSTRCVQGIVQINVGCGYACGNVQTVQTGGTVDSQTNISGNGTTFKTAWVNDAGTQHKAVAHVGDGSGFTGYY